MNALMERHKSGSCQRIHRETTGNILARVSAVSCFRCEQAIRQWRESESAHVFVAIIDDVR